MRKDMRAAQRSGLMSTQSIFEDIMNTMAPVRSAKRKMDTPEEHAKRMRIKLDELMDEILIDSRTEPAPRHHAKIPEIVASEGPVLPDSRIHTSFRGGNTSFAKTAFKAANDRGINGLQTRGIRAEPQTQQTVSEEHRKWACALMETGQIGEYFYDATDLQKDPVSETALLRANSTAKTLQNHVTVETLEEGVSTDAIIIPTADIIGECLEEKSILGGFHGGNSHEVVIGSGGQLNMKLTQNSQIIKPSSTSSHACLMKYTPDEYVNQSDATFGIFNHVIESAWHEIFAKTILENTPVPLPVPIRTEIGGADRMQQTRTFNCVLVSKAVFDSFLRTPLPGETPCIRGDRCQGNMINVKHNRPLVSFYCLQMAIHVNFSKITDRTLEEIKEKFFRENGDLKMGYCVMCINTSIANQYYYASAMGGNKAATRSSSAESLSGTKGDEIINPYQVIVGKTGEFDVHDCIASASAPTGLVGFVPMHNLSMYISVESVINGNRHIKYIMRTKPPRSVGSVF